MKNPTGEHSGASVVQTVPTDGTEVDPSLKEIRVTYNKEMMDGSWSACQISDETFPKPGEGKMHYLPDKRTCVMPVSLEPGKTYVIWLNRNQFQNFRDSQRNPAVPYLLVFAAAVCWSLYTNLAKRWLGEGDSNGVALFLLGGGLVLGILRLFSPETSTWDLPTFIRLAYVVLCPAFLAYTLWDLGTRKGQLILLAALSYFTPLFSTLVSALVLDTTISPQLWLGAGLIVLGAVLSQVGIRGK